MLHQVKIKSVNHATHDVLQIVTEKPNNYTFIPGQATDVSINKPGWENELRPFTFTCLPSDEYLEFNIKTYPSRNGVTHQLLFLKEDDEIILHDVFGEIIYKGQGVFIAGGAGITPFISIFRDLHSKSEVGNNKLIFANKTKADIILEDEFKALLNNNFINILSQENVDGYANGYISEDFLKEFVTEKNQYFYICGPDPMIEAVEKQLKNLDVPEHYIVKEGF